MVVFDAVNSQIFDVTNVRGSGKAKVLGKRGSYWYFDNKKIVVSQSKFTTSEKDVHPWLEQHVTHILKDETKTKSRFCLPHSILRLEQLNAFMTRLRKHLNPAQPRVSDLFLDILFP